MLPARIRDKEAEREARKQPNRTARFKSQKHRDYVRTFACCKCGETAGIEVAHVRLGSDGAMSRKPSDFYCVSLCKPCHTRQHSEGERTFWRGHNIAAIIEAFNETSPAKREIVAHKKAVANG
jgi:5-methylcytosine-specific restriction endonuclease McrA